jgi:YD repeat-containing protein
MKKTIISLAVLIAGMGQFYAQQQPSNGNTNIANIIPPSPTAYALGNYGNVPVGLFTGTANVSVPLFTYETENIEMPINMSYGSNGIRVDEISTNVGLGWNLNIGGVISRTVRDRPDDTSQKLQIPANAFSPNNTPAFKDFIYNVGNISSGIDTEADIYSFNFNGISGKFFYDRDNQIHLIEQQALKIEKITEGFTITTSTGEKYYFTEKEITNSKTLGVGHQLPNIGITAYYLTKIVHPKGDEMYFTYEDMYLNYTASQSQSFTLSMPYTTCQGAFIATPTGSMGVIAQNTMGINGKRIKTITSNNPVNGSVSFTYSTDSGNIDTDGNYKIQNIIQNDKNGYAVENISFNYLNTANKRNFLTGITFKDPQKSYAFEYESPSELPERLSYKRDYWGYYNGKSNQSLVPLVKDYNLNTYNYAGANQNPDPNFAKIGLLKKITYPTKGYTELEYEGNTYWGTKTIYPDYTNMNMTVANNTIAGIVTQQYTITSPVNQDIEISGTSLFNGNCSEQQQTHNPVGTVELIGSGTSHQFIPNQNNTFYYSVTAGSTFTLKLSASRCTYVDSNLKYYASAPQVFDTNLDTGGVRIKSTKDYDSSLPAPIYKRYFYGSKDDVNHSSGDKGVEPYFVSTYNSSEACSGGENTPSCVFIPRQFITLASNSLLPLFDTDKNTSTFYKYVTISHGGDSFEGGGETKEFIINRDSGGSHLWGSNTILTTPYTNYGWNNGLEVRSQILRKNSNGSLGIIQSKENNYVKKDANTFELKNFTHRRNDLVSCSTPMPYNCTQYDIANPDHACYGKSVGDVINTPFVDNVDVDEYKTISYWQYLNSQTTTDYFDGTPIATQTEYFYNNPSNYQLSKKKTTSSDGIINESNYSYAHEKGNQLMIDRNMVGIPLETTETQTIGNVTKTLEREETIYPTSLPTTQAGNLVLPLSEKSYDVLSNISSTDVTFDKYDDKGNIIQYTTKDGVPVAIVWGYNKTQPIAKVEGMTYDQITALSTTSSIVSASNEDATDSTKEGLLLTVLNNFRKESALAGKKIATYTYDPLIGVTSITPPSGIRETFVYDSFGRLKEGNLRLQNTTGSYIQQTGKKNNYQYKQ